MDTKGKFQMKCCTGKYEIMDADIDASVFCFLEKSPNIFTSDAVMFTGGIVKKRSTSISFI